MELSSVHDVEGKPAAKLAVGERSHLIPLYFGGWQNIPNT